MHRNVACTWSVIFSANNGPTTVLYSRASYVTFTRRIPQPHYATWWLSHMISSGVMLVYVIFSLISGVYESATVMSGKQYKRAVCGLISMMYEALMTCYMMSFSSGVRMYSWKQWKETSEIVI